MHNMQLMHSASRHLLCWTSITEKDATDYELLLWSCNLATVARLSRPFSTVICPAPRTDTGSVDTGFPLFFNSLVGPTPGELVDFSMMSGLLWMGSGVAVETNF